MADLLCVTQSKKHSPPKRLTPPKKRHTIMGSTTTTTVTKITKLVLKPKKDVRENVNRKTVITTNKYSSKPLTMQSTIVTGASYQIKNIPRKATGKNELSTKISKDINMERKLAARRFFRENHAKGPTHPTEDSQVKLTSGIDEKLAKLSATRVLNPNDTHKQASAILDKNNGLAWKQPDETYTTDERNNPGEQTKIIVSPVLKEITSAIINSIGANPTELKTPSHPIDKLEKSHNSPQIIRMLNSSPPSQVKCKRKSYDPIKARQFIRQQQDKRKEIEKEKAKGVQRKVEIRERLDKLRKNSLKIIGENVKRAKKENPVTSKVQSLGHQLKPKAKASNQKSKLCLPFFLFKAAFSKTFYSFYLSFFR